MPKGATQVIFECPEQFRRKIDQQKLKLGKSVKAMIMEALELYWDSQPDPGPALVVTLGRLVDDPQRAHWEEMFGEYVERCPPGKVELLQRVIEEDLKVHRRPRVKVDHADDKARSMEKSRRLSRRIKQRRRRRNEAAEQRQRRRRRSGAKHERT
jgi:hypothetical protein